MPILVPNAGISILGGARLLRVDMEAIVDLMKLPENRPGLVPRLLANDLPGDATFAGIYKVEGSKIWLWVRSKSFMDVKAIEVTPPEYTLAELA